MFSVFYKIKIITNHIIYQNLGRLQYPLVTYRKF